MVPSNNKIYRIDCLTSQAEFFAIKEKYISMVRNVPDLPIFLDWEWISTWFRVYGRDLSPWVLIALKKTGGLVGIAPWMIEQLRFGVIQIRRITFFGADRLAPCHFKVIVKEEKGSEICKAFLSYLESHNREWDVVDLKGVAENCTFRQNIAAECGRLFERVFFYCPSISLPDDWEAYQKSLHKKLVRNLRYYRSRLERENVGQVIFHRVTQADELSIAMDALIAMSRKRWHLKGAKSAFDDNRFVRFHREMSLRALGHGWLRFYQLKVADQIIAALYAFRYRDTYYAYQIGFDPLWSRYSPGRLLIAHVIQEAIKEGANVFDLLSGEQNYKLAWANNKRANYQLLFGKNFRGQVLVNIKSFGCFAKSYWRKFSNKN